MGVLNEFGGITASEEYEEPTEPHPSVEQVGAWIIDSVVDATDGCQVEPDGVCEHGSPSWLLYLGLI